MKVMLEMASCALNLISTFLLQNEKCLANVLSDLQVVSEDSLCT
jgi:hypothetical protein